MSQWLKLKLFVTCLFTVHCYVRLPKIITPEECQTVPTRFFSCEVLVPFDTVRDTKMEWLLFVQQDNDIWDYDIPPTPYTTTKRLKANKQTDSEDFTTLSFAVDVDIPSFVHLTVRFIHKENQFHNTSFGTDSIFIRATNQNYRKEAENLYNLYQNAQRVSTKVKHEQMELQTRYDVISTKYLSLTTDDTSLVPKIWSDRYLTDSFKHAVNTNNMKSFLELTGSDSIYKMSNIFTKEFIFRMTNEIHTAKGFMNNGDIELHRPNSMNNDGFVLAELGFAPLFDEFLRKWMSKITSSVYPFYLWCGEYLDSIHGFTIRYEHEFDRNLSRHMDQSQITFNLCLYNDDSIGSKIWFNGVRDNSDTMNENVSISLAANDALLHVGQNWHKTEDIQNGQRINLILWFRSSRCTKSVSQYALEMCPNVLPMKHAEL